MPQTLLYNINNWDLREQSNISSRTIQHDSAIVSGFPMLWRSKMSRTAEVAKTARGFLLVRDTWSPNRSCIGTQRGQCSPEAHRQLHRQMFGPAQHRTQLLENRWARLVHLTNTCECMYLEDHKPMCIHVLYLSLPSYRGLCYNAASDLHYPRQRKHMTASDQPPRSRALPGRCAVAHLVTSSFLLLVVMASNGLHRA